MSSPSTERKLLLSSEARRNILALALYDSMSEQDFPRIRYLLETRGADPNYVLPKYGISPIHCSICCGSEDFSFKVLSYCLLFGGNPNNRCIEGMTPVHLAALWGRLELLQLLLCHGGDPFLLDEEGNDAFDYGFEKGHTEITQFLHNFEKGNFLQHPAFCSLAKRKNAFTQTMSLTSDSIELQNSGSDSYISCNSDQMKCFSLNGMGSSSLQPLGNTSNVTAEDQGTPLISHRIDTFVDTNDTHFFEKSVPCNCEITENSKPEENSSLKLFEHPVVASQSMTHQSVSSQTEYIDVLHISEDCTSSNSLLDKAFLLNNSDMFSDIDSVSGCIVVDMSHSRPSPVSMDSTNQLPRFDISDEIPGEHNLFNQSDNNNVLNNCSSSFDIFHNSKNNQSKNTSCHDIFEETCGHDEKNDHSPVEEYITDDEGFVLIQRKFPPCPSGEESIESGKISDKDYDTDSLRDKLKRLSLFHGPITKTTKRLYLKQLRRSQKEDTPFVTYSTFGSIINRTLTEKHHNLIKEWSHLEDILVEDFNKNASLRNLPGGLSKCFFNYLLIDPDISNNLPLRAPDMVDVDLWKTFLLSIFYVGKGKHSRPYAHFHEALKPRNRKVKSAKVDKILTIWKKKKGVVCLQVFHNIMSAEALSREAAMIDALKGGNLTNSQAGNYYGITATWNVKQKIQLGAVLLYRALSIFLAEGERQISPPDL